MTRTLWFAAAVLSVCVLGCGGGESGSEGSSISAKAVDLEQIAIDTLESSCSSDPASPECRKAMEIVLRAEKENSLAAVEEWCAPVCLGAVDAVCVQASLALIEAGRLEPVARILQDEGEHAEALLTVCDDDTRLILEDAWCSTFPPDEACARFLRVRVSLGDETASERERQMGLRAVVADVFRKNRLNPASLLQHVRKDLQGIRELLLLAAQDPSMTLAEKSFIVAAVQSTGARAYPELVDLMKTEDLRVGLVAAETGWDRSAYEEDVHRHEEEPQRTVTLDESVDYVGKNLTIFHRDGTKRQGVLKRIEGEYLIVEVSIGGGAMTMKIRRDDVERIAF